MRMSRQTYLPTVLADYSTNVRAVYHEVALGEERTQHGIPDGKTLRRESTLHETAYRGSLIAGHDRPLPLRFPPRLAAILSWFLPSLPCAPERPGI